MKRFLIAALIMLTVLGGCTSKSEPVKPKVPTITTSEEITTTPAVTTTVNNLPPATPKPSVANCINNWNTAAELHNAHSIDAIYKVTTGRHDCYDRVVFSVNGTTDVGYSAQYSASDTIRVVIFAPPLGEDNGGHQPGQVLANAGDYLFSGNWLALKTVRYDGSFEADTTFTVGVASKLPFRVFSLLDIDNHIVKVVLDVKHDQQN